MQSLNKIFTMYAFIGLSLIVTAIEKAGYTGKVEIGMDVAASEFYREGKYDLDFKNPNSDKTAWLSGQELANLYQEFIKEFPVTSIEDPFDQDDWDAWSSFTANTNIQVSISEGVLPRAYPGFLFEVEGY